MKSPPRNLESTVCGHCAALNHNDPDFCAACGAPLTTRATTDPLAMAFAEGFAARRANRADRPIIVLGTWLWVLPIFLVSMHGTRYAVATFLDGILRPEVESLISGMLAGVISLPLLWITGTILCNTTMSYLASRTNQGAKAGDSTKE